MNAPTSRLCHFVIFCCVFLIGGVSTANGDLYQNYIRTIEWLVDNSDVIVVVSTQNREVQFLLKGKPEQIADELVPTKSDGRTYLSFAAKGESRLLFIRGRAELLHEVVVGRNVVFENMPKLLQVFYGVTHYGSILTSETELFRCIRERIDSGPGRRLAPKWPAAKTSGVSASSDFPLETSDQTYVLIVPFTVERRDHFIRELRNGDAAARIRAISELSQFQDSAARNAIREATKSQKTIPSICHNKYHGGLKKLTESDVVAAAKTALN